MNFWKKLFGKNKNITEVIVAVVMEDEVKVFDSIEHASRYFTDRNMTSAIESISKIKNKTERNVKAIKITEDFEIIEYPSLQKLKEDQSKNQNHKKMKKAQLFTLTALFLLLTSSSDAQRLSDIHSIDSRDQCGTMEVFERMKRLDPFYEKNVQEIEKLTQEYIKNNQGTPRQLITIPVVVHVVYKTTAENIPDAQIFDQIRILNEDFTKTHADAWKVPSWFAPYAADCQINFQLATRDPRNKPTTGIVRLKTSKNSFTTDDGMKFKNTGGSPCWPTDKYLNIWVCNLDQGGIIGYAVFPGSGYVLGDGIVVDYQAFGISSNNFPQYNLGRTATHEVGHWLNLRHIWGDDGTACTGSDFVDDTPNQGGPNGGGYAVNSIIISCDNGPYGDMWMNYMDYAWDISNYLFTNGQSDRMNAIFVTDPRRASLLTSGGLNIPNNPGSSNENSIVIMGNYPNPFNPSTVIRYSLKSAGFISLKVYDMLGKEIRTLVNENQTAGAHEVEFNASHLTSGVYFYKLEAPGFSEIKRMMLVK